MDIIGVLFIFVGVAFFAIGVLGVIRLPDAYSRLHASGKVSVLGLFGLLIGTGFLEPGTALKALALGLFMTLSAPVVSHAIAVAGRRAEQTNVPNATNSTGQR
ncbi:MAG: monovalent cation/H(+) antiporter subunit G [Chloroflexi bacterium]|nr:monovalent cation/H(+) antiporter subunit G [Chloroflexota bacterium]